MSTEQPEYRFDFSIRRRLPGEDDFIEVGYGSTDTWTSIKDAQYDMDSCIDNGMWDHASDSPTPVELLGGQDE